jgi:hypothetical protein
MVVHRCGAVEVWGLRGAAGVYTTCMHGCWARTPPPRHPPARAQAPVAFARASAAHGVLTVTGTVAACSLFGCLLNYALFLWVPCNP